MSIIAPPKSDKHWSTIDFASAGPGTPGGTILRRSWQPVYLAAALKPGAMVPIHVLGERFTLYRGESGTAHVVGFRCAHRNSQLSVGWVRGDAVQCLYHGWTYDATGACVARPSEQPPGPCAFVNIPSYPTREHVGLIFAYFGDDEPPALPFEGFEGEGIVDNFYVDFPCNWFQSFENVVDEAHARFVHSRSESHSDLNYNIVREELVTETPYGFERQTFVGDGPRRICVYPWPNHMRLMIGRIKGMTVGRSWLEAYVSMVPYDDENHHLFGAVHVPVSGADAETYREQQAAFRDRVMAAEPVGVVARDIIAGNRTLDDVLDHPLLLMVEDAVAQGAQGPRHDRSREVLGRTDAGVARARKVFEREIRAVIDGTPQKPLRYEGQPRPTQGF